MTQYGGASVMSGLRTVVLAVGMAFGGFVATGSVAKAADTFDYVPILTAQQQAIKDAIVGFRAEAEFGSFYAHRDYEPFWLQDEARIADLLDQLEHAGEHGLPVSFYDPSGIRDQIPRATDLKARADLELRLTWAFINYAQDLGSGVLVPSEVDREIQFRPKVKSGDAIMFGVLTAPSVADFAATLAPGSPAYARLMEEKKRLEAIISSGGWGRTVPAGKTLRPGRKSKSVVSLRRRLEHMGYGYLGDSPVYDEQLVMTVKLVQSRFGLNTDGVAGSGTLGAINISAKERLQQVLVNLERERWLTRDRGERHIMVNLADATMAVIDNGVPTFTSRVVVGRNQHDLRTPEFSHEMTHLIINPFWHVPKSIARKEYLPMLQQDPLALQKRGLWLLNRKGQRLNTEGADFSVFSENNFPFSIKQPPGGRNALGRVKFMFPNKNNIYLHDTPAKSLFVKDRRAYSHGCVRVQRPFDLAYHLLAPQVDDPVATFHATLKRGVEKQIDLERPVPIYLSYNSAWVTEDGVPHYRADVYKRDRRVFKALENAGVRVQALEG